MRRKVYIPILAFFAMLGVGLVAYGIVTLVASWEEWNAPNGAEIQQIETKRFE